MLSSVFSKLNYRVLESHIKNPVSSFADIGKLVDRGYKTTKTVMKEGHYLMKD